jgi:hypothetical protein
LDKALQENADAKRRFDAVLTQKEGANRTELATYQLLRMEEQKQLAEDYKKQLEDAQKILDTSVVERLTDLDHANFAVQAVLDGNVKLERNHWKKLEKRLADLKKSESPANTAERAVAQQELRAQEAVVAAAEQKRFAELDRAKSQRDAMEARLQKGEGVFITRDSKGIITKVEKKSLTGMRVIEGRKEALVTDEDKYNDRLREQAMQQLIDQEELVRRKELRNKQKDTIDDELEGLYKELASYAGPTDVAEINAAIANMKTTRAEREALTEKLEVWKEIQALEAQAAALVEGRPRRKQSPAMVDTTAKQAANKGFMSGSPDAIAQRQFEERNREETRAANEAAQAARGTKATPEPEPSTSRQGRMLDENIGLFDDFEFSRGVPTTGMNVKELTKELERGIGEKLLIGDEAFQGNRRLALYENPKEFMQANPQYAGKIPSDAKGFVDAGKASLFANNIGEGHGLGVLLHEVGVHIGFRNFFNENQYRALSSAVKSWAKKTDNSIEARVGKAAVERVEAAKTSAEHYDDELIAYAVEEAMNMGVRPDGVGPRSVAQNWLKMVVDAFKKALSKFGINPAQLTAGDMVNFAYGCAQIELKGTWHGAGVEFNEFDHTHMGKGEGAQAFGWGGYRAQNKGIARGYKNVATRNTNDRQELEWLENPEVQAWIAQQAPKIKGASLSKLSDYAAEGKEGDVKYGIPYKYSGVLSYALANANDMHFTGKLVGIDPQQHLRDFVNTLADDLVGNEDLY